MRNLIPVFLLGATLAFATAPASSAEFNIAASQSVENVLAAHKGKRVSVRLRSGQEISGSVKHVTPRLVQIAAIAGKEFFDAVVPLEAVEAVLIRTKD